VAQEYCDALDETQRVEQGGEAQQPTRIDRERSEHDEHHADGGSTIQMSVEQDQAITFEPRHGEHHGQHANCQGDEYQIGQYHGRE